MNKRFPISEAPSCVHTQPFPMTVLRFPTHRPTISFVVHNFFKNIHIYIYKLIDYQCLFLITVHCKLIRIRISRVLFGLYSKDRNPNTPLPLSLYPILSTVKLLVSNRSHHLQRLPWPPKTNQLSPRHTSSPSPTPGPPPVASMNLK